MSAERVVLLERKSAVLRITINRPERRNALTDEVLNGIADGFRQAEREQEIRVVVLTGAGDRAFCAGADLEPGKNFAFDCGRPTTPYADLARLASCSRVPSIARINGACVAGGLGLAAITDLAVASSTAVFGLPEVRVGLFPMQVYALLQDLVPKRLLREWTLCGERFDAEVARQSGLVNHVVAPEDLDAAVDRITSQILAGSPVAIRRGLWAMKQMNGRSLDDALAFGEAQIGPTAQTDDAAEGIRAFGEKRQPRWVPK